MSVRECSSCGGTCDGCDDDTEPHLCPICKKLQPFEVEFWPHRMVVVKAVSEEDALDRAIQENGWLGGSESTGHGLCFKVWVRKKTP